MRVPYQLDSLEKLQPLGIRTVIDIGAAAQTISLRKAFPYAHHHLFEPDPELCLQLPDNYRDTPHTIHNLAISDSMPLAIESIEWPAMLKVDTDFDEVAMLAACESIMSRVAVLMVEVTRQHLTGIVAFAASHRMILWDIVDLSYCGNQLHQVDMIFVAEHVSDQVFQPFSIEHFYAL